MQRLKDYLRFIAWQAGLSYLLLWAVTFWTLDEGVNVFANSGVCVPDGTKVLFYWVCDPSSPLTILASLANTALTLTVWAPVYLAAASVQPEAAVIAAPIIAVHVIGLPLGLLALVRMLAAAFDLRRRVASKRAEPPKDTVIAVSPAVPPPAAPEPLPPQRDQPIKPRRAMLKPRTEFGLRGRPLAGR
jgi:hypothetical protein